MSLDKSIEHGKEKRKPYLHSKAIDSTCCNHGSCIYCREGRLYQLRKELDRIKWQEEIVKGNISF